jgi:hypothetical protein
MTRHRSPRHRLRAFAGALGVSLSFAFVACSSDESGDGENDAAAGSAGSGGASGASSGGGGSSGTLSTGGSAGSSGGAAGAGGSAGAGTGGSGATGGAGAGGSGGSGGGGGTSADGGQPIGSLCVNDQNCSQAQGKTVCCAMPGCVAPCECQLETSCPGGTPFLPCNTSADCNQFGGGKVCCEVQSGGSTMRFCTKQNGCSGQVIP